MNKEIIDNRPRNIPVFLYPIKKNMEKLININFSFASGIQRAVLDKLPDFCPHCHRSITPNLANSNICTEERATVVLICPDHDCLEVFNAYYHIGANRGHGHELELFDVSYGKGRHTKFHESINTISPSFTPIYNEAEEAEQMGLLKVCGVGYRKALEFLIKDYAIDKNPGEDKKTEIESKFLGKVINEYIADQKIKDVAERAVWLGNDETHYVRKWDSDLGELKILIDLTVDMIKSDYNHKKVMEKYVKK